MEQGIGERVKEYMKRKIEYTDEKMDEVKVVSDFLPTPEELVFNEETVKVTLALSKRSVHFFKKLANQYHTPYQKMIRRLLDEYVMKQKAHS